MRISVDGSRIRNNKVAFSNLSGIVWTGPYKKKTRCSETNSVYKQIYKIINIYQWRSTRQPARSTAMSAGACI